jgi:protein-tyrosine phosphatase
MTTMALPPPRDPDGPYRVCLVCLGNICRSPMAEVVLREHLRATGLDGKVVVDSAGTGGWHIGEQMSSRARGALARRGYDGEAHRARQFDASWLPARDLVLAMDSSNLKVLAALAADLGEAQAIYQTSPALSAPNPAAAGSEGDAGPGVARLRLFGDVTGLAGADVPDPYGGNPAEFARVLGMLESAMPHLVVQLAELVE